MMTRTRILAAASLAAFLLQGCDAPATAPAHQDVELTASVNAPVHRASGGGTVDTDFGRSDYAWHASIDGAGNVSGQFELHFTSTDANIHGDVTCLVVDGNRAWLGGVVTRTSDPSLVADGQNFVWRAVDNGEGANAAPDQVSSYFLTAANRCALKILYATRVWSNGNVQIR